VPGGESPAGDDPERLHSFRKSPEPDPPDEPPNSLVLDDPQRGQLDSNTIADEPPGPNDVETTGSLSIGVTAHAEPALADFTANAAGTVLPPETSPSFVVVVAQQVSIGVEHLVESTIAELRDENGRLRAELAAAHIQIEFLERSLRLLRDAQASGRPSFISRTLQVVGTVFLATASGFAGGLAQGLVTGPPNVTVEGAQPASSASRAVELVQECDRLIALVDKLPETMPRAEETEGNR
jgi:hypothetical protein